MATSIGSSGVTFPDSSVQAASSKVLQVVSTALTSTFSSSSTTYVDVTGLSVSITPKFSTSKILVRIDISTSSTSMGIFQIVRGSTPIAIGDSGGGSHTQSTTEPLQWTGSNGDRGTYGGMTWLDQPATTSATTYKVQGYGDAGTWYLNRTASDSNAIYGPRSVSTITVMEIAA